MIATWALFAAAGGSLFVAYWQLNRFIASQMSNNTLGYISKFTEVLHQVRDGKAVSIDTAMATIGAYFNSAAMIRVYRANANAYRAGISGCAMTLTMEQIQLHLEVTNSLIVALGYFRGAGLLIGRGVLDFDIIWTYFEGMIRRLIDLSKSLSATEVFAQRAAEDTQFIGLLDRAERRNQNLLRRFAHWLADRLRIV